jgi:hypothetical protein
LKRIGLLAALMLAVILAFAAPVASAQTEGVTEDGREAVMMRPGEFVWYETESYVSVSMQPGNGIAVVVSIPAQLAYVYRDGMLIAVSTVSTGKPGKDTPTGEFTVLEKRVFHRSNLYSAAPMPFMQRLTWDGIALHAGHLPGFPASHGCIRLPKEFARKLFAITALGATVSVVDEYIDDPRVNPRAGQPMIHADIAALSGGYDMVTAGNDPAPSLIDAVKQQPASWVQGPSREIVQPLPTGTH